MRALGEVWQRLAGRVAAGRLAVLAAMDGRDDVVPSAPVGQAGAVFARHVLGQTRPVARRDAAWAQLLRPQVGDLPAVGAAYAAGDISTDHVQVAVRTHKRLGGRVRDTLVDARLPEPGSGSDADTIPAELLDALAGLSGSFSTRVRQILVVDVVLAFYARRLAVAELAAVAERIVAWLDPATAGGAHERRFLHMSQLPDGSWRGRFACGPEQGLRLKRILAAGSAPRLGLAIDADGVEHQIPDPRDLGARQMDALLDIANAALAKTGTTLPTHPDDTPAARVGENAAEAQPEPEHRDSASDSASDSDGDGDRDGDRDGDGG